jgi:hypothetical protein
MKIRRKTLKYSKLANHCKRISEKVGKQGSFASRLNFFFYILAYAWLITSYLEKIAFGSRVCKQEIRFSIKNINRVQIKEVRIGENSLSSDKVVWVHDQNHSGDHSSRNIHFDQKNGFNFIIWLCCICFNPSYKREGELCGKLTCIHHDYNSLHVMRDSWPRTNCKESGHFCTGWVLENESRFTVPSLFTCKSIPCWGGNRRYQKSDNLA